jgi:hypothetical protein
MRNSSLAIWIWVMLLWHYQWCVPNEASLPYYFLTVIDLRNIVVLDAYNTASLRIGTAFLLSFADPEDSCHQVQFPWASLWYVHEKVQRCKYLPASELYLLTLCLLGIMGPAFGRMASCLLMLKLFGTKQRLRQLLWFIFWESLVVNAITLILVFVQCKDVQSLWDPAGHPPVCWSPKVQEVSFYNVRQQWPRWWIYSILDSCKEAGDICDTVLR